MKQFLRRVGHYPTLLANGLLMHKTLLMLKSVGIVIEPYHFYQEGLFRPAPPADLADFEFVELGVESQPALARIVAIPPTREDLKTRFAEGQICFALKRGDRIAAFTWCQTADLSFGPFRRLLERHEAYLYGAETLYEFRGHRLQPHLRYKVYEALYAGGRHLLYSYCDYFNYPAIRFKEKLGARTLFTGLHLGLFGLWSKNWTLKKGAEAAEIPPPGSGG